MNAFFLSALQQYGYPMLWLVVFVAAVGVPVSGSLLLFAAGAFASFGDFNIFILFAVALSAAVMGDNLGYCIGRYLGTSVMAWLERQKRLRFITPQALEQARVSFVRRAGWTVFLTRFLIVALGGPINLLAGLEKYSYRHYLFWDVSGQILGAAISLGLGYAFAESWEEVAGLFGAFSSLVLTLVIIIAVAIMLVRKIQQSKSVRETKLMAKEQANDTTIALESQAEQACSSSPAPLQIESQIKQTSGPLCSLD